MLRSARNWRALRAVLGEFFTLKTARGHSSSDASAKSSERGETETNWVYGVAGMVADEETRSVSETQTVSVDRNP